MEIRMGILVPLTKEERMGYVERELQKIKGIVNVDARGSDLYVHADADKPSETKAIMANINKIDGARYVDRWDLI